MPVRSLNSSVLVWPDRATVDRAARAWAAAVARGRGELRRLGYCGSYLLVYTEAEWDAIIARGGRVADMLSGEVVWVWTAASDASSISGEPTGRHQKSEHDCTDYITSRTDMIAFLSPRRNRLEGLVLRHERVVFSGWFHGFRRRTCQDVGFTMTES